MSTTPNEMTLEALRSVPLFASLTDAAAIELRNLLTTEQVSASTELFHKGDSGNAMYQIENLCPPQIAVFCTLQLPIKRGNRFTSKKRVNHMTPNGNRAPRMSHKRHLGRTGRDRGATHRGA